MKRKERKKEIRRKKWGMSVICEEKKKEKKIMWVRGHVCVWWGKKRRLNKLFLICLLSENLLVQVYDIFCDIILCVIIFRFKCTVCP